jgi:hypothetical protein
MAIWLVAPWGLLAGGCLAQASLDLLILLTPVSLPELLGLQVCTAIPSLTWPFVLLCLVTIPACP